MILASICLLSLIGAFTAAPVSELSGLKGLNRQTCPDVLSPGPRIVGGSLAPELAPYMVSFFLPDGTFQCTGVLVSSQWILTAAHCELTNENGVRLGGAQAELGEMAQIESVFSHPSYNSATLDSDLTAVKLSTAAPSGSEFALVSVDETLPNVGAFTRAAGYGVTSFGQTDADNRLRKVDVPVVDEATCSSAYANIGLTITENMVCAGRSGCDACQGDSGGPLFQFSASTPVVVGIVSFGENCGLPEFPGVYTRISKFIPWLEQTGVSFGTGAGEQVRE